MTKQELLKELHFWLWQNDDLMEQDSLFEMQELVDKEIIAEVKQGTMEIKQLENGYISDIKIKRKIKRKED